MELPTILTMELSSAKNREKAKHKFKEFLVENGVKHIVARINHPQTNGKIEKFYV
ncbi:MAG TPA: transposase family protein [Methermicoccus shengliensis]|uniref:Transposase family protein n=1 Tax=Methermicoccus shengliensis TaxID=660064 RepID=A0A832VNL1_9EURY|nr:transposase family protein [Methermicoccus shengliensis]